MEPRNKSDNMKENNELPQEEGDIEGQIPDYLEQYELWGDLHRHMEKRLICKQPEFLDTPFCAQRE